MKTSQSIFSISAFVASVSAHGYILSPPPRMPGAAMAATCGNQVQINQASDNYGNIQGQLQVAAGQSDYDAAACNVWQCKGYKFDDNTQNVQTYTAGQVVPIEVEIRAPHDGVANVSIVDTASNTVIGAALKSWDSYASTARPISADEEQFDITIPSDLSNKCSTPGACVIQWYWNAASIDQTYEACIDFTVGKGGSPAPAPAPSSSAAPVVSSAAPTSTPVTIVDTPSTLSTIVVTSAPTSTPTEIPSLPELPGLTTILPSAVLTSALPAIPSATPNPGSPETEPTKSLPEGTTLKDLLQWLEAALTELLGAQN